MVMRDGGRDITAIKRIACGMQTGDTSLVRMRVLFIHHVLQGAREFRLHKHIACDRWFTTRQKHTLVLRPAAVIAFVVLDKTRHQPVHDKALACKTNGGRRHITKTHGAILFQRGDPRIRCGGNHRAQQARRHLAAILIDEHIDVRGARPCTQAIDGHHLALVGKVNNHWRDTSEVHQVGVQHAQCNTRRHAGVDGVAARFEHQKSGVCSGVMASGNHMPRAGDGWAISVHGFQSPLIL